MDARPSPQTIVGMRVSDVWFSDYSICYMELGHLFPGRVLPNGSTSHPVGEITVFLGYDWSAVIAGVEVSRMAYHAHRDERDTLVASVVGATIESASLVEPDMEIEIGLSTGVLLKSASTDNERPDWDVGFNHDPARQK